MRVLLLEDDEDDFLILKDTFSEIPGKPFVIDWVQNLESFILELHQKRHEVYLIDYRLPLQNGLEIIEAAIGDGFDGPYILLTGLDNADVDRRALDIGAADYLVKGKFTPETLERSLRYSIKQAQSFQELRSLNQHLEMRVRERTVDLENANFALLSAKEELERMLDWEKELNEHKTRFLTMASHEFRTPLSTILSSASLISKYATTEEEPKRFKHTERIKQAVHHLNAILQDFLSLQHLEEGQPPIQQEPLAISELMEFLRAETEVMRRNEQHLEISHKGNGQVYTDPFMVKTILLNLIVNAFKYSPEGATVSLASRLSSAAWDLEIHDQGIGIPKKDLSFLFTLFYRASNAGAVQGTGIGLHLVKRNVEALGGTIRVESQENKGTQFFIHLPFVNSSNEKANPHH